MEVKLSLDRVRTFGSLPVGTLAVGAHPSSGSGVWRKVPEKSIKYSHVRWHPHQTTINVVAKVAFVGL